MSSIPPGASPHLWGLDDVDMLSPCEGTFSRFGSVLATLDQPQRLPGSPHDNASVTQLRDPQALPDNAAQFSPPETTPFTDAQQAEPPEHGSVSGGKRYDCGTCKKAFKRLQDIMRHVRDIHDPPRQCPLCSYEWTRVYKIKAHLLKVHSDEFCPAVSAGIRVLRGHDVVKFIDAYELLRSFETPEVVGPLQGYSLTDRI
ncbi:hypothetical protein BJY52DRAFT_1212944 [Lactarius psammicola]|nr:hypothetical protein BJY52DRAFT_1212944 [Lactarius psammicola]